MLSASTTVDELVKCTVCLNYSQYILHKPLENQNHLNLSFYEKPLNPSSSQLKNLSSSQSSQLCQALYVRPPPASSSSKSQGPRSFVSQKERNRHKAAGLCIYCSEFNYWFQQCLQLQTALKKEFTHPRPNSTASSASSSFHTPLSIPSTSTITVLASSLNSGHSMPQSLRRQDL